MSLRLSVEDLERSAASAVSGGSVNDVDNVGRFEVGVKASGLYESSVASVDRVDGLWAE